MSEIINGKSISEKIIEELKEHLLDDDSLFFNRGEKGELEEVDPAKRFLSPKEFNKLSPTKKNELALKRYTERNHSKLEIGRMYERYIGYIYEKDDWLVKFIGIIENFDDLGRDLICEKNGSQLHFTEKICVSKFMQFSTCFGHVFVSTRHYTFSF